MFEIVILIYSVNCLFNGQYARFRQKNSHHDRKYVSYILTGNLKYGTNMGKLKMPKNVRNSKSGKHRVKKNMSNFGY